MSGILRKLDPSENCPENRIVKCACGLPMRSHGWAVHWNGCSNTGAAQVTERDVVDLLAHEKYMRETHQIEKLFCG